jgi:hypothetical protein
LHRAVPDRSMTYEQPRISPGIGATSSAFAVRLRRFASWVEAGQIRTGTACALMEVS